MVKKTKDTIDNIKIEKKINKKCITFCFVLFMIVVIKALLIPFIRNNPSFAMLYTKYFLNIKNGAMYSLMSWIPFVNTIANYYQIFILVMVGVGSGSIGYAFSKQSDDNTKKISKKKSLFANIGIVLLSLAIFLTAYDIIEYDQIESIPNMEKTIYRDSASREFTISDVEKLMDYLNKKIDYYSQSSYGALSEEEYVKQATDDLKNIKDKIPCLTGSYPSKIFSYDNKLKELYRSNLNGLTSNYLVFYNDYLPSTVSINTVTHEFCHTKSISKENEAVYCSYIAGINSNNDLSKYSAYLEAYFRIAFAYSTFNLDKSIEYEDKYTSKCLIENKEDFCYVYGKTNKEFIEGSKYIWIKTYSLKNYANYKEELVNALTRLVNNGYRLRLEIEDRNIKIDEVTNLIDSNSMDRIIIQEPIDKKGFDNIRESIANDKLFLAIMQMEDSDYRFTHGDALNFYLGKVENEDNYVDIYTYSRIIRLLLIYHDIYGYN